MEVSVVKAQKNNLLEVLYIIRECSRQLQAKGVKYWNSSLTDHFEIENDIKLGIVYLLRYNHVTVGTITLRPIPESKTLQIERLAIFPSYQKKGLARKLIDFAKEVARENNFNRIYGTIPVRDQNLVNLLESCNFTSKGYPTMNQVNMEMEEFECNL